MEGPQVRFHENGGGSSGGSPCLTHSKNIEKGKQGQGERFQTGLGILTQYLRRGRIY